MKKSRRLVQGKRRTRNRKAALTKGIKHLFDVLGVPADFPRTPVEGCVLVPFALISCIPKAAVRKFAAKKPFVVHVNNLGVKTLVAYAGDLHGCSGSL